MSLATVIFHGLFPDSTDPDSTSEPVIRIVYDVEFNGHLYSHEIANVAQDKTVTHDLPLECADFEKAVLAYHDYVIGQHGDLLSPSGPKGLLPANNVYRPEWEVRLEMTEKSAS